MGEWRGVVIIFIIINFHLKVVRRLFCLLQSSFQPPPASMHPPSLPVSLKRLRAKQVSADSRVTKERKKKKSSKGWVEYDEKREGTTLTVEIQGLDVSLHHSLDPNFL